MHVTGHRSATNTTSVYKLVKFNGQPNFYPQNSHEHDDVSLGPRIIIVKPIPSHPIRRRASQQPATHELTASERP